MTARGDRLLLVGALVVWCTAIVIKLAHALPLGHDEAAFTVGAQRWLDRAPEVFLARSVGTELLAMPGVALGTSVPWIRVCPALVTLLVPLGAFALAHAAFPQRRLGGLAAAVIASAHPMLFQASEVLSDLPAAGLMLVGLSVLMRELTRPKGGTWRTVVAAATFAAAFYVRYGSAPALAAVIVASAICYPRALFRPRMLALLAGTGAVLALPYAWWSYTQTGTFLGVLEASANSTYLEYVGQGLVTYTTSNPLAYYGVVVAPVMVLGLVGTLVLRDRSARYLGLIAIATLLALGLRSHAQPRYAFLFVALLVVNGVALAERVLTTQNWSRVGVVAVLVIVIPAWVYGIRNVIRSSVSTAGSRRTIAELGEAMHRHSAGRPCAFMAARTPQLTYYSGCIPRNWPDSPVAGEVYVVSLPEHPVDPIPGSVPLPGTNGAVMLVRP